MESDNFTAVDAQSIGQESGEIPESEDQNSDVDSGSNKMTDEDQNAYSASDSDSQTGDAMMDYSQSCPPIKELNLALQKVVSQGLRPQTLASLSPAELQFQLRYFHTTKVLEDLDLGGPVRCLNGTSISFNIARRRKGVSGVEKLAINHRTAIISLVLLDPRSLVTGANALVMSKKSASCFGVPLAGHGNQNSPSEPLRWDATSVVDLDIWATIVQREDQGSQGEQVHGHWPADTKLPSARKVESNELDYGDEDITNFLRPKITGAAPKGQIHIASQGFTKPQPGSRTANNEPFQGDSIRGSRQDRKWNDGRAGEDSYIRDPSPYSYRPSKRRSVSPRHAARASNGGIDNYTPPLPPGPPPRRARSRPASSRPSPRKEWSRRRI
ncbi:hypothetical protein MMC07_008423 [Pseudocyphellaria aurata]|nr:hypothetical protein [Pseudocyphellaria aurata]